MAPICKGHLLVKCPKCATDSVDQTECPACGIIFSRFYEPDPRVIVTPLVTDADLNRVKLPKPVELLLPLIAFVLAPILLKVFSPITWSFNMWIHEFGHAFACWWGGFAATPFLGWTSFSGSQSWWVTLCFSFLMGVFAYKSYEHRCYFLTSSFILMFLIQMYFRFVLNQREIMEMISDMGIAGEFMISTWLVIAYHYDFPENTHWQYLRLVLIFVGAFCFFNAMDLWKDIGMGKKDLPYGSLWGGADHGDMNNLVRGFGRSPKEITASYLRLGYFCMALIIINYIFQWIRFLTFHPPNRARGR